MTELDTVTRGTIEMTWDPESRLATLRFQSETHATGDDAAILIGVLTRWIGRTPGPFGLLGDGEGLAGLDAQYRSLWGRFLREHRDDARLAFFNMGPIIRIAAEMFRVGTGLQLKAFASEEGARAWLRKAGIPA